MRENYLKLVFCILLSMFSINSCMKFSFEMAPISMQCLAEFLAHKTLINTNSNDVRVRLFDPNGNAVFNKENTNSIKLTYTSTESGNHQICIDNYGNKHTIVNFDFKSGISARDYTELAKKENLKPIEVSLQKLEDMMKQILHEFTTIMFNEKTQISIGNSIGTKVILFSILTIIIMSLIGFSEVFYLKSYWKQRKLI